MKKQIKMEKIPEEQSKITEDKHCKQRRNFIKSALSIPILGIMGTGIYSKVKYDNSKKNINDIFKLNTSPNLMPKKPNGELIRLGIIGFGIRGKRLLQAVGFAEPSYIENLKEKAKKNPNHRGYQDFMEQEDLNVRITAVCDIFDKYGEDAIVAGANIYREGLNGKYGDAPKRYKHYKDLIKANDVDAVIIASPDHWHSQMAIDAAKEGKHVYLEKPLSWTLPETFIVRNVVKEAGIIFQLGHQGRHTDSYLRAKEIIDKGLLGRISLIEITTNRNSPNGAWVYPIIEGASPETIDWKQFEGPEERIKEYMDYMKGNGLEKYIGPEARSKFSLERFFRWRCWWDYSTGLNGDLLTHEFDAINQIMRMGIPDSVTSSGGIYCYKDGRTVPDVLHTCMEFSQKNFTLLYSATLGNENKRGKIFMGKDATMNLSNSISITADPQSTLYKEKIDQDIISAEKPFYTYTPGRAEVDGITSATEIYFAQRGLVDSYINGKKYNTTFLHLREWLECIRQNVTPSCNIDEAFDEAIAAHMGTRSYLEGRTLYWDRDKEVISKG